MIPARALAVRIACLSLIAALALGGLALGTINARRLGGDRFDLAGETLLAGARAVAAKAGPGYERRALASMPRGPLDGWFQRLDGALDTDTRVAGADAPLSALWSLEFDSAGPLLAVPPGSPAPRVEDGCLQTSRPWPAAVTHVHPAAIPLEEIGEIQIAVRSATSPQLILGWTTEQEIPAEPVKLWGPTAAVDLVPTSEPRVYAVDAAALRRQTPPGAVIRRFFLAPVTAPGASAKVDYLRVVSRVARLTARGSGTSYETLGGELRRTAFAAGDRSLEYTLQLPAAGPLELAFGLALLGGAEAARVDVEVVADGAPTSVYQQRPSPGEAWLDATVDLSAFAGREVRLRLTSAAEQDQVTLWAHPVVRGPPQRRFNVVLYLEDTLRADHLSLLGYARDTTPIKRALAREAVVFTQAIAQATKTRPSVASLMTSLPPSATGVAQFWERLDDGYLTLAEILRHRGFVTAALIQNPAAGRAAGLHQGFDRSADPATAGKRPSQVVESAAIPWLRRYGDRNFFLYVHVLDPHDPYEPVPPDDAWARELEPGSRAERIARYDGEIRAADRSFGRFRQALRELGLEDDTLVVYLSDHGEYLGEGGRWGHHPPGDPPVIHVPLVLTYPAGFQGGRRIAHPVQLLDVMPTILELAGIDPAPLALSGRSLVRLAQTGSDPALEERMLVSEEPTGHPLERRGRAEATGSFFFDGWQLQRSRARGRRGTRWLVGFHPTRAPQGGRDLLLTVDPWVRRRTASWMLDWQATQLGVWRDLASPGRGPVAVDPEANERLRALGYIQ